MIASIIESLQNESSRKSKEAILNTHVDNEQLKSFFTLALDPMITFGIKKVPPIPKTPYPGTPRTLAEAFGELTKLQTRELTGSDAIRFLTDLLRSLSPSDAGVLARVIEKEPRCGVQISTCNNVWGKSFIHDFPIMKAAARTPESMAKINYPAISQQKLDGARCVMLVSNGIVTVMSSSGREITTHGMFDYLASICNDVVVDGELLVLDQRGRIMPRKAGNGVVNKAIKHTISQPEAERLLFVAFDLIPLSDWNRQQCNIPYEQRWTNVQALWKLTPDTNMAVVDTIVVHNEAEAIAHFNKLHDLGMEGTVLKNVTGLWSNTRSADQVKLKGILTCDLLVVGIEPGTGKNTGKIGALQCVSSDNLLQVNVGSGLSDADRVRNDFVGRIVEIEYTERIVAETKQAVHSLFSPRFVCVRNDKKVADTIDLIV